MKRKSKNFNDEDYGGEAFGASIETGIQGVVGTGTWGALRMLAMVLFACTLITLGFSMVWVLGEKVPATNRIWEAARRELRQPCCLVFAGRVKEMSLKDAEIQDCIHILAEEARRSKINRCEWAQETLNSSRAMHVASSVWRHYFPFANYSPAEIFASSAASIATTWLWQYIVRRLVV